MTKEQISEVLEKVRSWPEQDQAELAEAAREIEARRTGIFVMTDDERAAVARGRESRLLTEAEASAFWKSLGIE
jgi:hypothetical protein